LVGKSAGIPRNSGFRNFFLVDFSDFVSDSDRKVGSRHFLNIPEPIPAINFLIFSAENCSRPFCPEKREKDIYPHMTRQKDIYLLVFEKKATSREMFFWRDGYGDDDDNDNDNDDDDNDDDDDDGDGGDDDDDDDDNDDDGDGDDDNDDDGDGDGDDDGDGDGRAPRGQWGATAAAGAADLASQLRHRGFPARACTIIFT
jgi:hypothetical protein